MATSYKPGTKKYHFEVGQIYGNWQVIGQDYSERYPQKSGKTKYVRKVPCRCICGLEQELFAVELASGRFFQCNACAAQDRSNQVPTYIYRAHFNMLKRCQDLNHASYKSYGGRGISVCETWRKSVETFYEDVGERPSKNHSLGRIDNDGNYCPENCRWESASTQARNKTVTRLISYRGKTQCLKDWSIELGINVSTLRYRLSRNQPLDRVFSTINFRGSPYDPGK